MGTVCRPRTVAVASLMALAALLLLLARGAGDASAAPFNPALSVGLGGPPPPPPPGGLTSGPAGAVQDIQTTTNWGNASDAGFFAGTANREFPSSFSGFTPGSWTIPDCSPTAVCPYPVGAQTGTANTRTTLGLLNSACVIGVTIAFAGAPQPPYPGPAATTPLLNASTDPSDVIAAGASFVNLTADVNPASGIMDGAEHWNDLLTFLGLPAPRERQIAHTVLFGSVPVWADIVTYDPGVLAPAGLGFITLTIVENFSPALPATPGLTTDSCGLRVSTTQQGLASNGAVHRRNPGLTFVGADTPGTKLFFGVSTSDRDADQGTSAPNEPTGPSATGRVGFVNSDDTCPFNPNLGDPHFPFAPLSGDIPPDDDRVDAACDPNPAVDDTFDIDADGYLNRGDNCPLVANGPPAGPPPANQSDLGEFVPHPQAVGPQPVDGGPTNDAIGDACDFAPHGGGRLPAVINHAGVSDGHFHKVLNVDAVCITSLASPAFADPDLDGWCNDFEVFFGSNPGNPASTPEALAIPTTCEDATDNDGDGANNLADTGCQKPIHDIAIRKITGDTTIGGASECQPAAPSGCGENIILQNFTAAEEKGQVGVILDPIFGAGCSGPSAILHGGSAKPSVVGSGPLNIDGDTDVEWLIKINVTIPANGQANVNVGVFFPTCGPTVGTPADYVKIVDLCHADDIAPLGLFGAAACGGVSDGGQDRPPANANDAPVTRIYNDVNR